MQKTTVRIIKNLKLALFVFLVALIGISLPHAGEAVLAQTGAPQTAPLESSVWAKRILARLRTINYDRIKDARRRAAVRRAVSAVKALAANTSQQHEAGLIANLKAAANGIKPVGKAKVGTGEKCMDEAEECDKNGFFLCDLALIDCLTAEYNEVNKAGDLPN